MTVSSQPRDGTVLGLEEASLESVELLVELPLGLGPLPACSSAAFMPKIPAMNESGSLGRCQPSLQRGGMYAVGTYEDDGNYCEDHDGPALSDRLLCLRHRLEGLDNARLLLFQVEEVLELCEKCAVSFTASEIQIGQCYSHLQK